MFGLIAKWTSTGNLRSYDFFIDTDNKLSFQYSDDGTYTSHYTQSTTTSAAFTSSDVGKWVHISVTVTVATKTFVFYKNGVSLSVTSNATSASSISNTTAQFQIGAREGGGSGYFDGLISNLRIWSDIRTAQEITDNMYSIVTGTSNNLVGSWFNDANDYNDDAGTNNLTSSGSPVFSTNTPWTGANTTDWTRVDKKIDHTKVSGSANLTNFPVLIKDGNIPDAMYAGLQSTGADFRITTDSAGTTEVPFEIVAIDTTAKTAEIWAKIPTVSYTVDTNIYLWYGNASATAYDANAPFGSQGVWSDYKAVYHMNESGGNRSESTSNTYTLTDVNTVLSAAGQIGTGADFESTNSEYFTGSNSIIPWGTNTLSIQFWQKSESTGVNQSYTMTARTNQGLLIYIAGGTLTFSKPNVVDLNKAITEDTNWHKYDFVADGTGMATSIDAGSETTNANTSNFVSPSSDSVHIGAYLSGGSLQAGWYRDGIIDEFRVRATRLTLDWRTTEYNNQNSPSTFLIAAGGARLLGLLGIGT